MNPKNTHTCTNPEQGSLVARYEMGWLSETESKQFEEHMMSCEFCTTEVQTMLPLARVMRNHKSELAAEFHKEGLSFDSLKQQLLASAPKQSSQQGVLEKFRAFFNRKVWIPTLVGAAALIIILNQINFKGSYRVGPTINLQEIVRDNVPTDMINSGIEKYQQHDYKAAKEIFKKAVQQVPNNAQVYFYLGATAYCLNEDNLAQESLNKADSLSEHAIPDAAYFLALLYKEHKEYEKAQQIAARLINEKQDQNGRAQKLLDEIKPVK